MEMMQTRFAVALAVVAALGGGFLLGRATAPSSGNDATDDTLRTVESRAPASAFDTRGDRDGQALTAPPQQASTPRSAAATSPPAGTTSPAPGPAQDVPPAGGPRPLLPDDGDALAALESQAASDGGAMQDLLELSRREPRDDDARRVEALLAASIRRLGDRYTRLRLSPPQCTASVCVIRGVGTSITEDPRADWQRLAGALTDEPWFHETFDETRTMVGAAAGRAVYLTVFTRCAPGACRFGSGRR
ncbi:hypothetical protein QFW80_00860 [Luteimonas sp. M1R5S18]|uniref:Uncharacterized protein n=1 Tax=Luteimonas rhizosphaericola TaxID=3042024 RepID=A0ABT6JEG5_9GAMM|nr:hypothetical protein [Luteimonas rhizosphaericola]MDH5829075.1 hypothetical protein [Luteimonas rhizosphaericola]